MTNSDSEPRVLARNELGKFKELIRIFAEEFDDEEYEEVPDGYLRDLLRQRGFYVVIALHNHRVVGGLTAYEITRYNKRASELFIYDFAVSKTFQRTGVGTAIMQYTTENARRGHIKECFVLANEEDKGAVEFYRAIGGNGDKAVSFTFKSARALPE